MLRNRLVLCLMVKDGLFQNSRQFTLNPVGNLETILQYLDFTTIDELVVLNVRRGEKQLAQFADELEKLVRHCFVPVAAGGGVRTLDDCSRLLNAGADKIVLNTAVVDSPEFVRAAVEVHGSQCIVNSIDVKSDRDGRKTVRISDGTVDTGRDPVSFAVASADLGVGELFVTSIDRDGTCQGYDLELLQEITQAVGVPVIASGGVGTFQHLVDGIKLGRASAVSAGNIFHFVGHSLSKAKKFVRENGLNFAEPMWNFQRDHKL